MNLESSLIILLAVLILTLDFKVWNKIDRVVALMLRERQQLLDSIEKITKQIESIERSIK